MGLRYPRAGLWCLLGRKSHTSSLEMLLHTALWLTLQPLSRETAGAAIMCVRGQCGVVRQVHGRHQFSHDILLPENARICVQVEPLGLDIEVDPPTRGLFVSRAP